MEELLGNSTTPLIIELTLSEIDPETCALLGPFALLVQGSMGILVISSLMLKRAREKPKRKWSVWLADVAKQVTGQAFVHASNVIISDLISKHAPNNPCSLYALNILLDTTLGLPILYFLLHAITALYKTYSSSPSHYIIGHYGEPFQFIKWIKQAAIYVQALGIMKIIVTILLVLIPNIGRFGDWALSWINDGQPKVLFVMGAFPIIMNVFQFYMIDQFLKATTTTLPQNSPSFSTATPSIPQFITQFFPPSKQTRSRKITQNDSALDPSRAFLIGDEDDSEMGDEENSLAMVPTRIMTHHNISLAHLPPSLSSSLTISIESSSPSTSIDNRTPP